MTTAKVATARADSGMAVDAPGAIACDRLHTGSTDARGYEHGPDPAARAAFGLPGDQRG